MLIWVQKAISSRKLRDPGTSGSIYLSRFLKKKEFLSKSNKLLLPSDLHRIGSVFIDVMHSAKNLSKSNTFVRKAL